MKTSILVAAIAASALSAPVVSAQEKSPPPKHVMSMDVDKHMGQMQDTMKAMQAQMDRIHKTTDAKERHKLMQEHMQAMHDHMKSMHGMGGPMMMEPMMQHDHAVESMPAR